MISALYGSPEPSTSLTFSKLHDVNDQKTCESLISAAFGRLQLIISRQKSRRLECFVMSPDYCVIAFAGSPAGIERNTKNCLLSYPFTCLCIACANKNFSRFSRICSSAQSLFSVINSEAVSPPRSQVSRFRRVRRPTVRKRYKRDEAKRDTRRGFRPVTGLSRAKATKGNAVDTSLGDSRLALSAQHLHSTQTFTLICLQFFYSIFHFQLNE